LLSIITNISLDHTQFLGDTLAKIAGEKAGIIKHDVPVVIGEAVDETRPVFTGKAQDVQAPIIFAEDTEQIISCKSSDTGGIDYETRGFGFLHGELGGSYQVKNTNTVLCAIRQLNLCNVFNISVDDIRKGFANVVEFTGLFGRWQKLRIAPAVVCDTGHNVGGWKYLSKQLVMQECNRLRIVFGMVDDKDIRTVMSMLPKDAVYYFTRATTKRAVSEQDVLQIAIENGLQGRCFHDVATAYDQALQEAGNDDFIFVGGSSYVVADLFAYLGKSGHEEMKA